MTEQFARQSKDKLAPNKYNKVLQTWKKTVAPRLKGAMSLKSDRIGYLDDAKYHSKQVPPAKYNITNFDIYKERSMKVLISNKGKHVGDRMDRIKMDKSKPAPGQYDCSASFKNTQLVNNSIGVAYSRGGKKIGFIDAYVKTKS